jgi:hypothetical protein
MQLFLCRLFFKSSNHSIFLSDEDIPNGFQKSERRSRLKSFEVYIEVHKKVRLEDQRINLLKDEGYITEKIDLPIHQCRILR